MKKLLLVSVIRRLLRSPHLRVAVLAAIAASCAGTPAQKQQDEIAVLDRAEEFVGALYHNDFGKWWDMMVPADKNFQISGADNREDYIKVWRKASEHITIVDYDSARIVVIGDRYAVTQSYVAYDVQEGDQKRSVKGCEKTIWLKLTEGWYWHKTGLDCDYLPSAQELEQLTRNLR